MPRGDAANARGAPAGGLPAFVRAIVAVVIALMAIRTFVVEPSHVPTGSMAPHRLGVHAPLLCPACRFPFAVGFGADGALARPICPNCGFRQFETGQGIFVRPGDRLWVSKVAWPGRPLRRWDEVVFYAPGAPFTPHLKRIVGLPGETIRIVDGDIFANGERVRKSADDRKRLSVLVFDSDFAAQEGTRPERWKFEVERPGEAYAATRWGVRRDPPDTFALRTGPAEGEVNGRASQAFDWAHYRHFCPIMDDYGPVRDFLAYDGPDDGQGHVVDDLWFTTRFMWMPDPERDPAIQFRLTTSETDIRVTLQELVEREPGENSGAFLGRVSIDGVTIVERRISDRSTALTFARFPGGHDVEMSWVDRRFEFRVAGKSIFDPIDLEAKPPRKPDERFRDSPVGFGVRGSEADVRSFRLYRDIRYTNRLATEPVIGYGVREEVALPCDGYFVLGDDSAHSVDSRFFEAGSAVPKSALIGRPIGQGRGF